MDDVIAKAAEAIKNSHRIVFLGGAGVSTASGIPDFRSPQGIYNVKSKYGVPYEVMLSHSFFETNPGIFYEFYWSTMVNLKAKPNKAHFALAEFEKRGHDIVIVTQNIDGLHQEAGSHRVLEVHGTTESYHCVGCGKAFDIHDITNHGVPRCPHCGGIIKPDVVLYEEPLDEQVLEEAVAVFQNADALIIGGTSLKVYPCAGLVDYFSGDNQIIINKEATGHDAYCRFVIHEDIGETLEALLKD